MREIIDQLENSLTSKNYYLSLMAALAVPDIAAALESPDGRASGQKYAEWFDKWVRPAAFAAMWDKIPAHSRFPELRETLNDAVLMGVDCYRFRCTMLHQGHTQHPQGKFARIMFVEPGAFAGPIHHGIINDALIIDLNSFCREVITGARGWLNSMASNPHYLANEPKSIRRHPAGLPGYVGGIPVIS